MTRTYGRLTISVATVLATGTAIAEAQDAAGPPYGEPYGQGAYIEPYEEGIPDNDGWVQDEGFYDPQGYPGPQAYPEQSEYTGQTGYPGQNGYPAQNAYPEQNQYPRQPGYPQPAAQQAGFQAPPPGPLPTLSDVPQGKTAMMDVNGFERPVPAYSFSRPQGYRVDAAMIAWSSQPCGGMTPMERLELSGPNGELIRSGGLKAWVEGADRLKAVLRQNGMTVPAQLQSCPDQKVVSAGQYLEQVAARTRPGARVVSRRSRPDIVADAYADFERDRAYATPQAQRALATAKLEAAEIVVAYDAPGGPRQEVMLTAMATAPVPDAPFPMTMQLTMGVMSLSAPEGSLDKAALEQVWTTSDPLPAYQRHQLVKDLQIERAQDAELAAFRRQAQKRLAAQNQRRSAGRYYNNSSRPGSTGNGTVQANSWDTFNNKMNTADRLSADSSDVMMDTTTVYDPMAGHDIAVEGTGMDVWQTDTGDIISKDANLGYDPLDNGISATKLEPVASGGGGDFWGSAITD